jgi:cysteine desulfurase
MVFMSHRFYLDYNATTPLAERARQAMLRYWEAGGANPSSVHAEGRWARGTVDEARDQVAAALKVKPSEIVFTGGGTESNNLAVLGLARIQADKGKHIITSQIEHHAVLQACEALEKQEGFQVTYLPVDGQGRLAPECVQEAIRAETVLVSIMSANNETGVKSPLREIGALCAAKGVLFHTDAVQSAGKESLAVENWGVSALSLAGHKFYGPTGVGILVLRAGLPIRRIFFGGAQENERRPGTENVVAIAGLATVVDELRVDPVESDRQFRWIEALWAGLKDISGVVRNGDPLERIPNTLNVSFIGMEGEDLLMGLDLEGIAASSGSACLVGSVQPSHVLQAMGVSEKQAKATVRFSIGKKTRDEDLVEVIRRVKKVVERQRELLGK